MKRYTLYLIILILGACVQQPQEPVSNIPEMGRPGAYILCEGLWGMDNSTLSRYDYSTGIFVNDYFPLVNPGFRLGDVATDIVIHGDTAYVVVSSSKTIEAFSALTGKTLGRLYFNGRSCPRSLAIYNDTLGFVTDLYNNSVIEFNTSTLKEKSIRIPVGPAPEGIALFGNLLFVANSGYGDYFANKPKAGTISVIDIESKAEIVLLQNIPNVQKLLINPMKQRLYAAFTNLPSHPDSSGGIVEFDIMTQKELRRWSAKPAAIALSPLGDTLFILDEKGVFIVEIDSINAAPRLLIENFDEGEFWYSIAYSTIDNTIWIGNAKNYQVNGEILIYNLNGSLIKRFPAGVNPNKIVFFL